ncbi:MAG TPA: DoxX family protein [candidate division Zixibacteria bacterium]|nr:DoxX family protein [candidate division Zixibacteria bacterium]
MGWIFDTAPSYALLPLRLGLAVTFFFHSTQQIFGWFGGRGARGQLQNWRDKHGIPVPVGALGLLIEFFGCFALLAGLLTRPFALGLAVFIAIAMFKSHLGHGFFLARRPGEESGIEYTLALLLMAVALVIGGGGALSVDRLLSD